MDPFHPQCTCPEVGGPKSDHLASISKGPRQKIEYFARVPGHGRGGGGDFFNRFQTLKEGPKPRNGTQMVRFGSPDLRTGALGVKRVRGIVSPYSRGRPTPKKAQNGENTCFIPPPGPATQTMLPVCCLFWTDDEPPNMYFCICFVSDLYSSCHIKAYLKARFSLSSKMYPHELKF